MDAKESVVADFMNHDNLNFSEDESGDSDGPRSKTRKNMWEFLFNCMKKPVKFAKLKSCIERSHEEKDTYANLQNQKKLEEFFRVKFGKQISENSSPKDKSPLASPKTVKRV